MYQVIPKITQISVYHRIFYKYNPNALRKNPFGVHSNHHIVETHNGGYSCCIQSF